MLVKGGVELLRGASPLLPTFLWVEGPPRVQILLTCGWGNTIWGPPYWHSISNEIEEAVASPRRDLGGLRFQTGFGAGA